MSYNTIAQNIYKFSTQSEEGYVWLEILVPNIFRILISSSSKLHIDIFCRYS